MRSRIPSPATVIACVALFVALGGTSIAAINYAKRAGAVDGKSAVSASASTGKAAGKLVATNKSGDNKGKLPAKFVAGVPRASNYGVAQSVTDNQTGAPATVGVVDGIGSLTASCIDENQAVGIENPATTLTLTNNAPEAINRATRVGGNGAAVTAQAPATVESVTISGSNSFEYHIQYKGTDVVFEGAVRQDGRGTPDAKCLIFGTMTQVG